MNITLLVSIIFAAIVFFGSIYHSLRMKGKINWYLVLLYTAAAFAGPWAIYGLGELAEL